MYWHYVIQYWICAGYCVILVYDTIMNILIKVYLDLNDKQSWDTFDRKQQQQEPNVIYGLLYIHCVLRTQYTCTATYLYSGLKTHIDSKTGKPASLLTVNNNNVLKKRPDLGIYDHKPKKERKVGIFLFNISESVSDSVWFAFYGPLILTKIRVWSHQQQ